MSASAVDLPANFIREKSRKNNFSHPAHGFMCSAGPPDSTGIVIGKEFKLGMIPAIKACVAAKRQSDHEADGGKHKAGGKAYMLSSIHMFTLVRIVGQFPSKEGITLDMGTPYNCSRLEAVRGVLRTLAVLLMVCKGNKPRTSEQDTKVPIRFGRLIRRNISSPTRANIASLDWVASTAAS